MTRLAPILDEQKLTYTTVAERAHLQPRPSGSWPPVRRPSTTSRWVPCAGSPRPCRSPSPHFSGQRLLFPGDVSVPRGRWISAAIRGVMWPDAATPYLSPVEGDDIGEGGQADEIGALPADEFFVDHAARSMPGAAEVYRRVAEAGRARRPAISRVLWLARTRLTGEMPPGDRFDPRPGRIPGVPAAPGRRGAAA